MSHEPDQPSTGSSTADPRSRCPDFFASVPGHTDLDADGLLGAHADIVARIRLCFGLDRESYERDVLTLMRRYAALVHLLPATIDNYFRAPGGMLRLGLETAFFSLQGTDAHIFSGRATITERRALEPRWRLATFIGGLCCEQHRVLSHMTVSDGAGRSWSAYQQPLATWMAGCRTKDAVLHWHAQAPECRALSVFALHHVVAPPQMEVLAHGNSPILAHLLSSLCATPMPRERNVLGELVRRALALVIDRHLITTAGPSAAPVRGRHVERYLVDTLQRLAGTSSAWTVNAEKSRVWFGLDGLFLLWPAAGVDMCRLIEAERLAGLPTDPDTLREVLTAAGVFCAPPSNQPTWSIQPPGIRTLLPAVRLTMPDLLLTGLQTPPVALAQALVPANHTPAPAPPPLPVTQSSQPPPPATPIAEAATPPATPVAAGATTQTPPPEPAPPAPPSFQLQAPLRLQARVRDTLAAVVASLNADSGPPRCCPMQDCLFVPLREFERPDLQPSTALRALVDTGMLALATPKGNPAVSREFQGKPTIGVLVRSHFVAGLANRDPVAAETAGH